MFSLRLYSTRKTREKASVSLGTDGDTFAITFLSSRNVAKFCAVFHLNLEFRRNVRKRGRAMSGFLKLDLLPENYRKPKIQGRRPADYTAHRI
jgi:hypothetical protein